MKCGTQTILSAWQDSSAGISFLKWLERAASDVSGEEGPDKNKSKTKRKLELEREQLSID